MYSQISTKAPPHYASRQTCLATSAAPTRPQEKQVVATSAALTRPQEKLVVATSAALTRLQEKHVVWQPNSTSSTPQCHESSMSSGLVTSATFHPRLPSLCPSPRSPSLCPSPPLVCPISLRFFLSFLRYIMVNM